MSVHRRRPRWRPDWSLVLGLWIAALGVAVLITGLAGAATTSKSVTCSAGDDGTTLTLRCPSERTTVTATAAGPTITQTVTASASASIGSGGPTSTAPSPTSPANTGCMAVPSACGYPDASNTGAGRGLTVWQGDYHTSRDGQVVSGLDIRGTLYIDNSGVVARNFKATGAGGSSWGVVVGQHATVTGVAISDCTIDGGRSDQGGISAQGASTSWSMTRCDISNGENGIRPSGHATVSDCWVHDLASSAAAPHYDAVEVYSGTGSVFDHDTLILNHDQTSVLNVQGDFGPVAGTVLSNSLVNGGGWTLNIRSLAASVTGTVVTNNRFGDDHGYGYAAINDGTTTAISGNVRDTTGANIDGQI